MSGEKIIQLRDAMFAILDDLKGNDHFSIITFSYGVNVWASQEVDPINKDDHGKRVDIMAATKNNKDVAIAFTNSLKAGGGTNINDAMLEGLRMIKEKIETPDLLPENTQAMVVFLTDGMPSVGTTSKPVIKSNIARANNLELPLYCIGFGQDADFSLMKEISEDAQSWAKMIYEGGDAAIQLEDFYAQISSPVISDLSFRYVGVVEDEKDAVDEKVKVVMKGSSSTHVGKLKDDVEILDIQLLGQDSSGVMEKRLRVCLRPGPVRSPDTCIPPSTRKPRSAAQNFMQKLHAYVHITKLTKRGRKADEVRESDSARALRLALANSFVTSLTSLVVTAADDRTSLASLRGRGEVDRPQPRYNSGLRSSVVRPASRPGRRGGYSQSSYGSYNRQSSSHSSTTKGYMLASPMNSPTMLASPVNNVQSSWVPHKKRTQSRPVAGSRGGGGGHQDPAYESFTRSGGGPAMAYPDFQDDEDCSISLYASTYLRGNTTTITEDVEDLDNLDFDDKVVSLSVESCCWTLYTEPSYSGEEKSFGPGEYRSTSSAGNLFRKASSIKMTPGAC